MLQQIRKQIYLLQSLQKNFLDISTLNDFLTLFTPNIIELLTSQWLSIAVLPYEMRHLLTVIIISATNARNYNSITRHNVHVIIYNKIGEYSNKYYNKGSLYYLTCILQLHIVCEKLMKACHIRRFRFSISPEDVPIDRPFASAMLVIMM